MKNFISKVIAIKFVTENDSETFEEPMQDANNQNTKTHRIEVSDFENLEKKEREKMIRLIKKVEKCSSDLLNSRDAVSCAIQELRIKQLL
jgi:hypothetical protein